MRRLAARELLAAALAWASVPGAPALEVRLIGRCELENTVAAAGAPRVGGLSGLDYDAATDRWIAVSDDREEHGPARAYTLRIDYDARQVTRAAAETMTRLATPEEERPDFEAVRIDPRTGQRWLATEGDPVRKTGPAVWIADAAGKHLGAFS